MKKLLLVVFILTIVVSAAYSQFLSSRPRDGFSVGDNCKFTGSTSIGQPVSTVGNPTQMLEKSDTNGDIVAADTVTASSLSNDSQYVGRERWAITNGNLEQIDFNGILKLNDDAEIQLLSSTPGFGVVVVGDAAEYAWFVFTSTADVTIVSSSANVANTDSDTNLCIYDSGDVVAIKNRLGVSMNIRCAFFYSAL